MFSIDPALIPSLSTRKALLVIDPQNDFLAEDGALPAAIPIDLAQNIANLANGFRQRGGEVIWVQTQFEESRLAEDEQIFTSDSPLAPTRGRQPRVEPPTAAADSPEAFLTVQAGKDPVCVVPGAPGTEMHPAVKAAVALNDHICVKTHYSAFKSEALVRLLRVRLVTELFICGSVINVGVMATAIDAASYGYTITLVDDCCGALNFGRRTTAMRQIISTTGCAKLTAQDVLESLAPAKPDAPPPRMGGGDISGRVARGSPRVRRNPRGKAEQVVSSSTSDIQSSLARLPLNGEATAEKRTRRLSSEQRQERRSAAQIHWTRGGPRSTTPSAKLHAEATELNGARNKSKEDDVQHNANNNEQRPIEKKTSFSSDKVYDSNKTSFKSINNSLKELSLSAEKEPSKISAIEDTKNTTKMTSEETKDPNQSAPLCEGDTRIHYDVLPQWLEEDAFEKLVKEVDWKRMSHQGGEVPRLVAVQGAIDVDGSMPVYRHPADESPSLLAFTPTVDKMRHVIEAKLGHPLNHVLIQLYRHGNDYISEHSDKTIDIVKGSFIANLSLGAERMMTFRTKRQANKPPTPESLKRQVQKAALPHNSLCQMGLKTNERWLHAIRQDKRLPRDKSKATLAFDGVRISLTFRHIGTFIDGESKRIWGQGATSKTKEGARAIINGQTTEAVDMVRAFGRENQSSDFDWDAHYGAGFDVLHITTSARFFLGSDPVVNMRVQMMLAELDIGYARGSMTNIASGDVPMKFIDNDDCKTVAHGQTGIMLYLWGAYGEKNTDQSDKDYSLSARERFARFKQALALLDAWRKATSMPGDSKDKEQEIIKLLAPFEEMLRHEWEFIAGPELGLADFALWPVLHAILASSPSLLVDTDEEKEKEEEGDEPSEKPELFYLSKYYFGIRKSRQLDARLLGSADEPDRKRERGKKKGRKKGKRTGRAVPTRPIEPRTT
ncbi:hypothetical protein F5Y16DRAFT_407892 [Xylariaceae sp. FL0255]|nr:hypothetical protein F5Y16DRAFT_407892 [Xylariaceae sp. FL0255]